MKTLLVVPAFILALLLAVLLLPSTAPHARAQDKPGVTRIAISGSDTMNLLTQRLAEVYNREHKEVEISVKGGGTGVGIRDLTEGLVDIAQASRKMKQEELDKATRNGFEPEEVVVGLDAIAVGVHKNHPAKDMSLNQLKAIFSGTVTRWNQLNPEWPNAQITLYARESSSGTYDFFREHVLRGADFAPNAIHLSATAAIVNAVAKDPNAIGFGGVAYFVHNPDAKVLAVRKDRESQPFLPVTAEGNHVANEVIQSGEYPISRPLQYYRRKNARPDVRHFLDWVNSPAGQAIVAELDYIPLATPKTGAATAATGATTAP